MTTAEDQSIDLDAVRSSYDRVASMGGILGWWSLFNLPRGTLATVVESFARASFPAGRSWSVFTWGTGTCGEPSQRPG